MASPLFVNLKQRLNSLIIKIIFGEVIITALIITMWTVNNAYAIQVVRNQVYDSHKNTITLYIRQIDRTLNEIDRSLVSLGMNENVSTHLGTDLEMGTISKNNKQNIEAEIAAGNMTFADVETAVRNVLTAYGKIGYLGLVDVKQPHI